MGFEGNKKTIIKVLIVVIIALALFAGYIVLVNNPTFKIKSAVRYIFKETDSILQLAEKSSISNSIFENKTEVTNRMTAKVSLSDDVKNLIGPVSKSIEDLVNNSIIETNIKSDIPNKYSDVELNYSYNNEKIKANAYLDNNEIYVLIKDYFDKYIKVTDEKVLQDAVKEVKVDEIRYLVDVLKNSIVDAVSYGTINDSKVLIDIDEEKISVNKTTLTIDTKFTNQVTTILLNKILMDNKAKDIIIKLSGSDTYPNVTALEDDIRDQLLNIENTNYDNEVIGEYSLYTSGIFNKVVRNEIKSFDENNTVLQYTTYKTIKFDTQTSIFENNELVAKVNVKETSPDNYDITSTYGKNMSMDVKGIISQSKVDVNYTLRISGLNDIKGDLNVETRNISKSEINQTFTFRLNTPESYGTINLTVDSTIKTIENITKPDFTNNVGYEDITSTEISDIYTNFVNKNPELINAISKIIGE
ncbi:MAG: hypothetical protein K0R72_1117 [Clostridia bacterium]|jgi:hypothetical protein|nr:hypothetical protein [Clostridia bacterium]